MDTFSIFQSIRSEFPFNVCILPIRCIRYLRVKEYIEKTVHQILHIFESGVLNH